MRLIILNDSLETASRC